MALSLSLSLCADYTTLERDREFRRGELEFIIKYSIVISRQLGDAYPAGMILNRYTPPSSLLPPPKRYSIPTRLYLDIFADATRVMEILLTLSKLFRREHDS